MKTRLIITVTYTTSAVVKLAQLVEPCTGFTEVMCSNPVEFHNCHITAMIIDVFSSFSEVQIYDISCVHSEHVINEVFNNTYLLKLSAKVSLIIWR